jgi:hypothetical protein
MVSSVELADHRKTLAGTRMNSSADVQFFMNKIAYGDRANQWYHGGTLGNLFAGSTGTHLNALVDKWMRGGGSSNSQDDELWVALLEKAYAQRNESGWIGQDVTNSYLGIESGTESNAFKQIAGTATTILFAFQEGDH